MVAINLLPKFHSIPIKWLVFTLSVLIIVWCVHLTYQKKILQQERQIVLLHKEIHAIDANLSNADKKPSHLNSIDSKYDTILLSLLKKLPVCMPIGTYLTALSINPHKKLYLEGYAEQITQVKICMQKITEQRLNVSLAEMTKNKNSADFPVKFCLCLGF